MQQETRATAFPYGGGTLFCRWTVSRRVWEPQCERRGSSPAASVTFWSGQNQDHRIYAQHTTWPPKPNAAETIIHHTKARTNDRHCTPCTTFSSVAANTLEASHLDRQSRCGTVARDSWDTEEPESRASADGATQSVPRTFPLRRTCISPSELAIIATIFAQRSEAGAPVCNGPAE